ncbi:hypothetical protein GON01_08675 [Sphingomonas sp. MAH-20]|uniref:Gfo/Idh/MocA-like oxidoreductase N-terminal domain-containing protein n=1 Tax=Sphingomonas horti TaxID=2682842 RepID=A0A6I4J151_9SPHN|nr:MULTISPECIES: Gfo/Idh/MocA family oxidoreductase [Sphingomonas]MBA2919765.1 Gfo/Idh/MocA family oxidoreductase [Sphingomonas sp. CGMCC 1.13658]MVO78006.1 hypothetical protein [Sphingomonas horti]
MIKAAVIGCGRMGAFTSESVKRSAPPCWFPLAHAEAMAAHPAVDLAALCDPDPAQLERARAAYGVQAGLADYHTVLSTIRPALVGIATRTPGRARIIEECIAAGTRALHVEKPLCNTVAELDALASLFERPDIHVSYGAIRRLFRIYHYARELAGSGQFGRLLDIRVSMGAGALYWTHPHSVDLILWAAGDRRVTGVQARLANVELGGITSHVVSDPVIEGASIWFDDGTVGHIGRAIGADLVLSCEAGEVAVVNDGDSISISTSPTNGPYPKRSILEWQAEQVPEGTYAAIDQLVRCLAGEAEAQTINATIKRDIIVGQRILFAFVQSHLEKSRLISLQEVNPSMRIDARSGLRAA